MENSDNHSIFNEFRRLAREMRLQAKSREELNLIKGTVLTTSVMSMADAEIETGSDGSVTATFDIRVRDIVALVKWVYLAYGQPDLEKIEILNKIPPESLVLATVGFLSIEAMSDGHDSGKILDEWARCLDEPDDIPVPVGGSVQ